MLSSTAVGTDERELYSEYVYNFENKICLQTRLPAMYRKYKGLHEYLINKSVESFLVTLPHVWQP